MKKSIILILLLVASCSTYNIEKDIYGTSELKTISDLVIVLRLPKSSSITHEKLEKNCKQWLAGYTLKKNIAFSDYTETVSSYSDKASSFYQESAGNEYLKYKSLGVIKTFSAENENALKTIMNTYNTENIMIYEVGGTYSKILKALRFSTVVTILNSDMEVVYLDHQKKYVGDGEFDIDGVEYEFLDKISDRLIVTLSEFGYIEEK